MKIYFEVGFFVLSTVLYIGGIIFDDTRAMLVGGVGLLMIRLDNISDRIKR